MNHPLTYNSDEIQGGGEGLIMDLGVTVDKASEADQVAGQHKASLTVPVHFLPIGCELLWRIFLKENNTQVLRQNFHSIPLKSSSPVLTYRVLFSMTNSNVGFSCSYRDVSLI